MGLLRIFSTFLLVTLFSGSIFAQDATQWRGANRDGIYNENNLLKVWPEAGPELLWHYDELGLSHSSAAVYNDIVYTAGIIKEEGFVIALDFNGKELWKTVYGKEWLESFEGVRTTPNINDGILYIMSGYGLITAMELNTGDILWQIDILQKYSGVNIRWGVTENLLIEGDQLICMPGGSENNVISLNKKTGKLIWKSKAMGDESAYCSPQLAEHNGKKIIITHSANNVIALDLNSGELLWNYEFKNQWSVHPNTPIYKEGMVFCASGYGKGGVMLKISDDNKSVSEVWSNADLDNQVGGFVLVDGKIYGSGMKSRKWLCLDWNTGKELYSTKEYKVGTIIAADGLLYFYTQSGDVMLVEAQETQFNVLSKFKVPFGAKQHWAHMVINKGILYVRHGESIMAYKISK